MIKIINTDTRHQDRNDLDEYTYLDEYIEYIQKSIEIDPVLWLGTIFLVTVLSVLHNSLYYGSLLLFLSLIVTWKTSSLRAIKQAPRFLLLPTLSILIFSLFFLGVAQTPAYILLFLLRILPLYFHFWCFFNNVDAYSLSLSLKSKRIPLKYFFPLFFSLFLFQELDRQFAFLLGIQQKGEKTNSFFSWVKSIRSNLHLYVISLLDLSTEYIQIYSEISLSTLFTNNQSNSLIHHQVGKASILLFLIHFLCIIFFLFNEIWIMRY